MPEGQCAVQSLPLIRDSCLAILSATKASPLLELAPFASAAAEWHAASSFLDAAFTWKAEATKSAMWRTSTSSSHRSSAAPLWMDHLLFARM